jgi:branched-chain amino acid transport system ATP-binding protein
MEKGSSMPGRDEMQLKVNRLSIAFGGVQALIELSFEVKKGEIFSIIGPNGAGKTVLLNCINGLYRPQKGQIFFEGKEITRLKPHQRAKLGISRTFQKIELFKGATVLDNIRLGRHIHYQSGLISSAVYF